MYTENAVQLAGKVVTEPMTQSSKSGRVYTKFVIDTGRNDNHVYIEVISFNENFPIIHGGDEILVKGKITSSTFQKQNGEKAFNHSIFSNDIFFLAKQFQEPEKVISNDGFEKGFDTGRPVSIDSDDLPF